MAINYTHVDGDGLFDILGKLYQLIKTVNTARGTTIAADVLDVINQYKKKTDTTLAFDRAFEGLADREYSARVGLGSLPSSARKAAESLIIHFIQAETDSVRETLLPSLQYLIDAMVEDEYYVDDSAVSEVVAAVAGGSSTDLVVAATIVGKKGVASQYVYDEVITATVTAGGSSPRLKFVGELAARDSLAEDWPAGSGVTRTLAPLSTANSVLSNGDFELDTYDDSPDSWVVEEGVPGTTLTFTEPAVQTISVTGPPTEGTFSLKYTHPVTGLIYTTKTLAYNATGASIQSALAALPGLGSIEVSSVQGAFWLHTITFTGVAGEVDVLTGVDNTDGTITPAITTAGDTGAITGRGLRLVKHATVKQDLYQQITISPQTVYALGYWATPSAEVDSGRITVSLVDSIGGTIVQDDAGNDQSDNWNLSGNTDAEHHTAFFQVAETTQMPIYLRLEKSTAESVADIVLDDLILSPATQLYSGGPYVSVFAGITDPVLDDQWTVTVSNDYTGDIQQYSNAVFDLAKKGLQLPTSGTDLIPDSLIA